MSVVVRSSNLVCPRDGAILISYRYRCRYISSSKDVGCRAFEQPGLSTWWCNMNMIYMYIDISIAAFEQSGLFTRWCSFQVGSSFQHVSWNHSVIPCVVPPESQTYHLFGTWYHVRRLTKMWRAFERLLLILITQRSEWYAAKARQETSTTRIPSEHTYATQLAGTGPTSSYFLSSLFYVVSY